jgi:carbamoyl-phosphate synthase small subunit
MRRLVDEGARVTVVPPSVTPSELGALHPSALMISNGPGDPDAVEYAPATIKAIAERGVPMFGICLGHQLLGLTFGANTVKMPYGHRGGNHPVRELETGRILITSQNHGFAVQGSEEAIPGAPALQVTHVNLNDGTVEGLRHRELPVFAVQYHPEAAPGPHDARPLFEQFMETVRKRRG